jgi:hypothetical protein
MLSKTRTTKNLILQHRAFLLLDFLPRFLSISFKIYRTGLVPCCSNFSYLTAGYCLHAHNAHIVLLHSIHVPVIQRNINQTLSHLTLQRSCFYLGTSGSGGGGGSSSSSSSSSSRAIFLDRLIITQLVKKYPAFYGTRLFITVFTKSSHYVQSSDNSINLLKFLITKETLKRRQENTGIR